MTEACRLIREALDSGLNVYQISEITGVSRPTIRSWSSRLVEYQGVKSDRVIDKLQQLKGDNPIPPLRPNGQTEEGYRQLHAVGIAEMNEARKLLIDAHESMSARQIHRIIGIDMKTIHKWMTEEPRYQGVKTDRVSEKIRMLSSFNHYVPDVSQRKRAGKEWVPRMYAALDGMTKLGLDTHRIAYISGIGQAHVVRLMRSDRSRKKNVTTHVAHGVERLEQYLKARRKSGRGTARQKPSALRSEDHMDGATTG
jgi:transposase